MAMPEVTLDIETNDDIGVAVQIWFLHLMVI